MPARARGPSSTHPPAKARAAKPAPKPGAQTSSANSSYQQMRVAAERRSLPRDAGGIGTGTAETRPGGPVSPGLSTEQSAAIVREVSEGYAAISSMREATMRRREQVAQLAPRPPRA